MRVLASAAALALTAASVAQARAADEAALIAPSFFTTIAPLPAPDGERLIVPTNAHWLVAADFIDEANSAPSFTRVVADDLEALPATRFAASGVGAFTFDVELDGAGALVPGDTVVASCSQCAGIDLVMTVGDGPDETAPVFRDGLRNRVTTTFLDGIGWQVKACVPGLDDAEGNAAAMRIESDSATALVPLVAGACGPDEVDIAVIAQEVRERRFCMDVFGVDLAGNDVELGQETCVDLEIPPGANLGGCAQSGEAPALAGAVLFVVMIVRRKRC